jgi:hypothetical protein
MRLDKKVGMALPDNNFIYGKTPVGWYFMLRLRFWTKIKAIVCPYDFDTHSVLSYPIVYITTHLSHSRQKLRSKIVWLACDDWVWEAHTSKMIQNYVEIGKK